MHYARFKVYGNPFVTKRAPNGSGYVHHGYLMIHHSGKSIAVHRELCEKAIGRPLMHPEEVHHFNKNKTDNGHSNLVICPNKAYHKLLYQRADALDSCGHADWRKCQHCQRWDNVENLTIDKNNHVYHRVCQNNYARLSYANRMAGRVAI